jgi:hypothetical protein
LQLCEAESVSYLDEVATSPNSMQLGHTLALEVSSPMVDHFPEKYYSDSIVIEITISYSKNFVHMIISGS